MSVSNTTEFANREVCDLIILDYRTQKPVFQCDYANTTSQDLTSNTVFAYGGKNHPGLVAFNGERAGTFTIETQIQTFQLYQILTGATASDSAKYIEREVVKADSESALTISGTPATANAADISVFLASDDCGTLITPTGISGTSITCSGLTAGQEYAVYYMKSVTTKVKSLNIKSTVFPRAVSIYADTYMKTPDEEILPYKMVVYKAQPEGNITLSNSNTGDPATLTATFQLLADKDHNMLDMILQDETA